MSASNFTQNLKLSQFSASDKPTWQGDYNSDMQKIDAAYESQDTNVEDIRGQVETNTTDIQTINQSINGLQVTVNGHTSGIQSLNGRATALENETSTLQSEVETLQDDVSMITSNDSWVIVGDSYGAHAVDYMSTIVSMNPNRTIYDVCKPSAGFTVKGNSFLLNLQNAISTIDVDRVSKVAVIGGLNDNGKAYSDILAAVKAFVSYVKANIPRARIYMGFCGGSIASNYNGTTIGGTINSYRDASARTDTTWMSGLEFLCKKYDMYEEGDQSHPNAAGAELIGLAINSFLHTGGYINHNFDPVNLTVTLDDNWTSSTVTMNMRTIGDFMEVNFGELIKLQSTVEIQGASWQLVATFSRAYFNGPTIQLGTYVFTDLNGEKYLLSLSIQNKNQLMVKSMNTPNNVPANHPVYAIVPAFNYDLRYC